MKRNILLILIIGVLVLISLTSIAYGFVQRVEAERQAAIAIENEMRTIACEKMTAEMHVRLSSTTEQLREALVEMQKQAEAKNKK